MFTTGLATWMCRRRELRPLDFGGVGVSSGIGGGSSGRGRGGDLEGGGAYEMVPMRGEGEV